MLIKNALSRSSRRVVHNLLVAQSVIQKHGASGDQRRYEKTMCVHLVGPASGGIRLQHKKQKHGRHMLSTTLSSRGTHTGAPFRMVVIYRDQFSFEFDTPSLPPHCNLKY